VLSALDQDEVGWRYVDIDVDKVKRIKGTANGWGFHRAYFLNSAGKEVSWIKLGENAGFAPEQVLEDGEQIVGVYGSKNSKTSITSLGFIVWKPSRQT